MPACVALWIVCLLTIPWPAYSDAPRPGTVRSHQKISSTAGGFTGPLKELDHFGWAVASPGDINRDGTPDLVAGVYAADDGGGERGALWVLFLNRDGTVQSQKRISATEGGFTGTLADGDVFGWAVTGLGDLDADGTPDIAVAARGDDTGGDACGAVWILFLTPSGTVKGHQKISAQPPGLLQSLGPWIGRPRPFVLPLHVDDEFGVAVAGLGDVNGDGVADLAVASRLDDDGGKDRGAIWILFLNRDGTVKDGQKISSTQGGFTGALDDQDEFGFSLASFGDFDGDGIADLAAGARWDDDGGKDRGAVWLLLLNRNGTVKTSHKISDTQGKLTGILRDQDEFGAALASVGDLDSDGTTDLAVGARLDNDGGMSAGAIWVLFLNRDGTVKRQQKISAYDGQFSGTLEEGDWFSSALASLGPFKRDGTFALAAGAEGDDDGGPMLGAIWILFLHTAEKGISPISPVTN